ncbi:MAG: GNAT family N-acetyltransferase [Myxococcales bacterium]|nr:GNAT family N-acetyltransferase [Myxococcales bacterium]
MGSFEIHEVDGQKADICRSTLEALPDWFGIPEALEEYVRASSSMPMLAAFEDSRAVGFVSLAVHFGNACEIYVMGVLQERHRSGIGRALVTASEAFARDRGCALMTVKTVGPSREDEDYRKTRKFYLAMGFLPIEEFPNLWPGNPCLFLAKPLPAGTVGA